MLIWRLGGIVSLEFVKDLWRILCDLTAPDRLGRGPGGRRGLGRGRVKTVCDRSADRRVVGRMTGRDGGKSETTTWRTIMAYCFGVASILQDLSVQVEKEFVV